jgi:hypothetical protein
MIIRRRHTANFTTISNTLFDDNRLKADEVGILAYLLSRPHDWEVRRPALQRRWGIGREAMKRVIWNWIRTGWCLPVRSHAPNGTTFVIYDIRDMPGPEMTDEEVRNALSLGSGGADADDGDVIHTPEGYGAPQSEVSETGQPPTGYPSLADPSPGDPSLAYKDIPNKDLPRDESNQNSERERTRAREKHALHLADFKRRWPTSASDDQSRIDEAWFALTPEEADAALTGITPFLEKLKRDKRTTVPAGWKYLRERRWTLLEQAAPSAPSGYPRDSIEARALINLHEVFGKGAPFRQIFVRDVVSYRKAEMCERIRKFAEMPPRDQWVQITTRNKDGKNEVGAWTAFGRDFCALPGAKVFAEGDYAPWCFPPSVEGKLYPPESLMTAQDEADFK